VTSIKEQLAKKEEDYKKLTQIKKDIEAWKSDIKDFSKYLVNFSEEEITSYFYDYSNNNVWKVRIESISITPW
jgi:ABC-type Fe3+-citrate transport system substrate-binding protein